MRRLPAPPVLLVLLAAAPAAAQAGYGGGTDYDGEARARVQLRSYEVQGRSEGDLLQAMLRSGPEWESERYFGLTTSEVRYAYWKTPVAGGCELTGIVVTSAIMITLPRWEPRPGSPYALERAWRLFDRALRIHEDGHRRLIEEEGEQIRRALAALQTPSCDTMDGEAQRLVERIRQQYSELHHGYDRRTEHGRTQGAQWPIER